MAGDQALDCGDFEEKGWPLCFGIRGDWSLGCARCFRGLREKLDIESNTCYYEQIAEKGLRGWSHDLSGSRHWRD